MRLSPFKSTVCADKVALSALFSYNNYKLCKFNHDSRFRYIISLNGGKVMLHLILGRAGSGKTRYVSCLLGDLIENGAQHMVLLVPEQFSFQTERGLINLFGAKKASNVDVLSFSRLSDSVYHEFGGMVKQRIDESGQSAVISLALDAVKDNLDVFGGNCENVQLISSMLEIANEMKRCCVEPETLGRAADLMEDCTLKKKSNEIALIISAYNAILEQSFLNPNDELTILCRAIAENKFFGGRIVFIDSFSGFTAQEMNIVEQIMTQSVDTYITLCTDNLDETQDGMGIFSIVRKTGRRLIETAKRNNVRVASPIRLTEPYRFENDALRIVEAGLWNPYAKPSEEPTDAVTICEAQNIFDECDWVASAAKRLMREDGLRCRDIAVISRSSGAYEAKIKAAFKKYGIPAFEDNRQPIDSQPLMILVRQAFEIINGGFASDDIMRYLKTGLAGFSVEQISVLENYVLMWKISGNRWTEEWKSHPDGFQQEYSDDVKERLSEINSIREKVIMPLKRFKSKCEDKSGEEIARAVFSLLEDINAGENLKKFAIELDESGETSLAVEQSRIWDMLMNILDQSAVILKDTVISPVRYAHLLDIMIGVQDIGSIPQGLDEIQFGSADRMRTSNPRAVFIVGANEGVFPLTPASGGVLTESDRKKLIGLGVEIAAPFEQQAIEEYFMAYCALSSAKERLYVSYSITDISGSPSDGSAIVSQLEKLLPNCRRVNTVTADETDLIEGEKPAFELMAEKWNDNSPLSASLRKYFENRKDYAGKIAGVKRAAETLPAKFGDEAKATMLFGENMYVSASRIEDYYKCRFEYFCKFGLNAKPRKTAELDPMQSGTIIHYVLEKMIKKYGGKGLTELGGNEAENCIKELLKEYLNEYMGGISDKASRFTYLFSRLSKTLFALISQLAKEFAQSSFEPADFELSIDRDGEIKPLTLLLPSGGEISVRGKIDRVDVMKRNDVTYVRVVDYKTGVKEFHLSDVMYGLNMQMLIYLICLWNNGKERYGNIIPAGVLYMPARRPMPSLDRNASEAEIVRKHEGALRMNGLVLDSEEVIRGMETSAKGIFIPVRENKDGMKGSLISLEQMGKLAQKIDGLLVEMGETLHRGDIAAEPVFGSGYDACEWCDYSAVCGHEDGGSVRKILKTDNDKVLKELEAGEDNE